MDHGNLGSTGCPNVTPPAGNHYVTLPTFANISEQSLSYPQTTTPASFQIAVQLLNSIVSLEKESTTQNTTDDFLSNVSGHGNVDLSTLTRRLITLAASVSPTSVNQTFSSCTNGMASFGHASGSSPDTTVSIPNSDSNPGVKSQVSFPESAAECNGVKPFPLSWPTTSSPSAIMAFHNALTQLALLGLSSHSSDTSENGTNIVRSINESGAVQSDTNSVRTMNGETIHSKAKVESPPISRLSPPVPPELGTKVIIRQTADADEHFFKALRGLKVDVSNGATSMTAKLPTITSHSNLVNKPENARAAAELAVEEHFEKSLAAFPGFTSLRELAVNGNTCKPELSSIGSPTETHISALNSRTYTRVRSALKSAGEDDDAVMMRQSLRDSPSRANSPKVKNHVTEIPKPPPYSLQHALHYLQSCASANLYYSAVTQSRFPEAIKSEEPTRYPVSVASDCESSENTSLPNTHMCSSVMNVHNSFKPKKNWIVQYGEKVGHRDAVFVRPVGTNVFGLDLSSSSPNIPAQPPRLIAEQELRSSSLSSPSRRSKSHESTQFESTHQSLTIEQSESVKQELNHCPTNLEDDYIVHASDCASQQQDSFSDKLRIGNIQEQPRGCTWNHLQKDLQKDKPSIFQESHDTSNQHIPKTDANSSMRLADDWTGLKRSNPHGLDEKVGISLDVPADAECTVSLRHSACEIPASLLTEDAKPLLNWGLSNSSSPSPAPEESSSNSAITPVSGVTSGFFSGSTYSLDSSLSHAQSLVFEARESDSGIDAKSTSSATDDHVFCDSKVHTLMESSRNLDASEQTGCSYSPRKRASSEANPWSTLKRSRSVLTSPVSCSDTFQTCSPGSNEHVHTIDGDFMPANKRIAMLSEFACRSVDGTGRPLNSDAANLQTLRSASPSRKTPDRFLGNSVISSSIDPCLPCSCTLNPQPCDQMLGSRPTAMSSQPGVTTTGRSV